MGLRAVYLGTALSGALLAAACAAEVRIEPSDTNSGGGGEGASSPTTSSGPNAFQSYCAELEADEVEKDCIDGFDASACLASEACANELLRPDAAPILLECIARRGCWGVSDECLWGDLAEIPLTETGRVIYEACVDACGDSLFCYQAYWLTDEALASSARCIETRDCGSDDTCFDETALGQCSGWLRAVNPWYR